MKPLPDIAEFGFAHSEIAKSEEQIFRIKFCLEPRALGFVADPNCHRQLTR